MSIEFVSHESFPEDQYTSELVYLLIDKKYRVAYVRKPTKQGGKFWSLPSVSCTKNGEKVFFQTFMQDSTFQESDIRTFLERRSWENQVSAPRDIVVSSQRYQDSEIPF
jgi:hypothetical protein